MSHPLLLLAEATAPATGESASGVTQIFDAFGVRGPLLLAQIVNFLVVAFLLWKFAFKPVLATIDERQQKIESGLAYADEMKAKLEAAERDTEARLREAAVKAQHIVADAQKAAKEYEERQQREAVERANGIITKAQAAIELEKKKMLAEARTEIARLVVATTQRVLAKELSEGERARYNESAARELTQA